MIEFKIAADVKSETVIKILKRELPGTPFKAGGINFGKISKVRSDGDGNVYARFDISAVAMADKVLEQTR